MQNLTIEERERVAYITGDTRTADTLAEIMDQAGQIELLDQELGEALDDSLSEWEKNHGPAQDYYEFFHECFAHLDGHYPAPSVTSDYDKGVIFEMIRKGSEVQE